MEPEKEILGKELGGFAKVEKGQQGLRATVGKVGSVHGAMGRLALFALP
ncbi:hypothetical protein TIFTF001_023665 [Ficus carica]|uniref:Uncharacterized protein n=1 Tax=Ficus carica TaxID=3494 RepID=A0AA88ALC3_FICCA|nr:hypothetical protein TIFTF001_023665 [Ficus carica]